VIEDLETNYWAVGHKIYGYPLKGTGISSEKHAVAKFKQIQEVLIHRQIGAKDLSVMPGDDTICSVEWGMNLVAFHKCHKDAEFASWQGKMYNEAKMEEWIKNAKKTNPDEDGPFIPED